jgi:hypothetical protein
VSGAACGESSADLSPVGPSGNTPPAASGATIVGRVNSGSGLAQTTHGGPAGITVTVAGTSISGAVDGLGQFTLTGVPAGPIELRFTGPGVNATVTITITGQEQLQLAITINGNSASVEAQHRRDKDDRAEIKGWVTAVDPVARTLHVAGSLVNVPETATIRRGSHRLELSDLQVGDRVEVRGAMEGSSFNATEIKVEGERRDSTVELRGLVSERAGECPSLTFSVHGTSVSTTGATYFKGGLCDAVQDLVEVRVKGKRQADGSVLASQVRMEEDDDDDEDDEDRDDAKAEGTVADAPTGACPAIAFTLGTTVVTTSAATKFEGGVCADIIAGVEVEVRGVRQEDGSIAAARVEIDD